MVRLHAKRKGLLNKSNSIKGSSSTNPVSMRHRNAAKSQRLAKICPLIAVDDRMEGGDKDNALLKHLPMNRVNLAEQDTPDTVVDERAETTVNERASDLTEMVLLSHLPLLSLTEKDIEVKLEENELDPTERSKAAQILLEQLESALNVHNAKAWEFVLGKMTYLVEKAGLTLLGETFTRVLRTLAELRDKDDKCFCADEIDKFFATTLRSIGLENLISSVPLNLDLDAPVLSQDFKRSWLLPIIIKNLQNDSLEFVHQTILPMAFRLFKRLPQLAQMPQKLYNTIELQLWTILLRCLSNAPKDFQKAMPALAPLIWKTLTDRPELRLTMLGSIRAALKADLKNNCRIMERFAKNFMPIIFGLYANEEELERKGVRLSALETIRLYVAETPQQLLHHHIGLILQKIGKVEDKDQKIDNRKLMFADLLIALCKCADVDDLRSVFDALRPWFFSRSGSLQKKAYRLMAQIYQRISEQKVEPFFSSNWSFIESLIQSGIKGLHKPVLHWRVAVYRSILESFVHFDVLHKFCDSIYVEVLALLNPRYSRPTRRQAAKCVQEMYSGLIRLGSQEEIIPSNGISSLLSNLIKHFEANQLDGELNCKLIALNILAQKYVRQMDASTLSQLISQAGKALKTEDPVARSTALRLMRIICLKMEHFMFDQYKELITEAIFSQNTKTTTVRVRKSNALLLGLLLDKIGLEKLMRDAGERFIWVNMLKNLEKMRKRKQRKREGIVGKTMMEKYRQRSAMSMTGAASSLVSGISGISSMISKNAKTAKVDSIFDILEDSSDEEGRQSGVKKAKKSKIRSTFVEDAKNPRSTLSMVIEEGEDEFVDLLDKKSVLNKVKVTERQNRTDERGRKRGGGRMEERGQEDEGEGQPFKVNKEGKLLITDLDGRKGAKKRRLKVGKEDPQKQKSVDVDCKSDGSF